MTLSVVCANPTDSVDRCRVLLSQHRIRHLPVREGKSTASEFCRVATFWKSFSTKKEHLLRDLEIERLAIMSNPGVY